MKKTLTLVVPAYNEQEALPIFYDEAMRVYETSLKDKVELEFLFIDDGSKDDTMAVIHKLNESDHRVHYVSFSRNFGKEAAIYAGLENAAGEYVAILDADLQDPPALLPEMLRIVEEEHYDCVGSRRVTRKGEPPIRSFFARQFYKLMGKISQTEIVDGARDFQLMNKKVVNAILSMGEYNRFSKGIFGWIGFKKKWLEYENIERAAGETKWSFWKLFIYALDGIIAFSTAPLIVSSVMGVVMCLVAFLAIIFIIVRTLIFGDPTSGWPSMVCIIVLIAGIQLLSIGILGQYMAKTYLETKNRPKYLIEEAKLKDKEVL
ncbi:MAG: glycosyltransferase family 2 protein [Lachnospiraceae bacterium]|nr:glycosyltransferase family 2 protein [Lachnospiraceae bacterium]